MAKSKQGLHTPMYWAIILIGLALILTNWAWYQRSKDQDITNRNQSSAWLNQQVQINKLKTCIDNNTSPCNINSAD